MGLRFVHKIGRDRPTTGVIPNTPIENNSSETQKKKENKKTKKDNMDTLEQIETAEELAKELQPEVKVVKKERGLIERTESSKIILTEDNRQVLND